MARIRTVKPEFWTDEKIVAMTPYARLLFIGLLNFVDDEGRAAYSPGRLKLQIFPADTADFPALLGEIRREGLIAVYEVDGKEYFEICNFSKHQKVDKRTASKLPPPPNPPESPRIVPTEGKGRVGIGREEENKNTACAVSSEKYVFESGVIRLTASDFDKWEKSFSYLDLRAELIGLTQWASEQEKWLFAISGALAKRNREAKLALERPPQSKRILQPNGQPWPDGII